MAVTVLDLKTQPHKRSYSPRSQRQELRLRQLRDELTEAEDAARGSRAWIERLESEADKWAQSSRWYAKESLSEKLQSLHKEKLLLPVYEKRVASIKAQIGELEHLSAEQAAARAKGQADFADAVLKRLAKVREIDAAVASLRRLLEQHAAISAELENLAGKIDFSNGNFDQARFRELLERLPAAMLPESQEWLPWLFGEDRENRQAYSVGPNRLSFEETLASAHVYEPHETCYLHEAEAEPQLKERRNEHGFFYAPLTAIGDIEESLKAAG